MARANQEAIDRIKAARSKSLRLMELDANGTLDKISENHRDDIDGSLIEGNTATINDMMSTKVNRMHTNMPRMSAAANNVPSAIRESFANNPIDNSSLYTAMSSDGMDMSFLTEGIQPQQKRVVNETIQQPNIQQVQSQIDYPMIKTIVEEIVRKYAVSLNKKIINENKGSVNEISTIAFGKTFKFLDNSGNIYECTMKKVGNINNKKKKETI